MFKRILLFLPGAIILFFNYKLAIIYTMLVSFIILVYNWRQKTDK